jgi:hypothetical protein
MVSTASEAGPAWPQTPSAQAIVKRTLSDAGKDTIIEADDEVYAMLGM